MKLCPRKDESQLSATEVAVHELQVVDSDLGLSFRVASMEVREAVIVEEHDDGDPKEAADCRHASIMPTPPAVRAQTKHFAFARPWASLAVPRSLEDCWRRKALVGSNPTPSVKSALRPLAHRLEGP